MSHDEGKRGGKKREGRKATTAVECVNRSAACQTGEIILPDIGEASAECCPVLGGAGGSPGQNCENEQRWRKNMTCKAVLEEMGLFSLEDIQKRGDERTPNAYRVSAERMGTKACNGGSEQCSNTES